jgi:hypothetical protein
MPPEVREDVRPPLSRVRIRHLNSLRVLLAAIAAALPHNEMKECITGAYATILRCGWSLKHM